jgi:hypothetical protein
MNFLKHENGEANIIPVGSIIYIVQKDRDGRIFVECSKVSGYQATMNPTDVYKGVWVKYRLAGSHLWADAINVYFDMETALVCKEKWGYRSHSVTHPDKVQFLSSVKGVSTKGWSEVSYDWAGK